MTTDDKQPARGAQPGGSGTDATKPKDFIDRDDDQSPVRVDSDYEPEFPGEPGDGDEAPDPGYVAFSHELGDPLAGWPTPDTEQENPPARRRSDDVAADGWLRRSGDRKQDGARSDREAATGRDYSDAPPGEYPQDRPAAFDSDRDEAAESAAPSAGDMLFSDGDAAPGALSADSVDRDSSSDAGTGDTPFTARPRKPEPVTGQTTDSGPSSPASAPPKPASAHEFVTAPGAATGSATTEDDIPSPPDAPQVARAADEPEELELMEEEAEDFEDEFVDDFLNDLDVPEHSADDLLDDEPLDEPGDSEAVSDAAEAVSNLTIGAADPDRTSGARLTDTQTASTMPREDAATERSLPVGMIAVVLVALALLAVGGYGVIQQRSELQAEIRDLQSRLATAPSAEEAEAERERQRQLALENESLGAEVEALSAENSALATQLASLEDQLAQRTAEAEAAEAAEAEARRAAEAAARDAAAQAAAARATAPEAAPAGPWFVNFGSYTQRDVADSWAGKLRVDNGKVVVQTATAAGKTLYRVRVVGLSSQDAAERVATALEREYRLPRLWVGRN